MKNRGNESVFTTGALILMLSLTLFYGCRAFDPEPVVVNLAPDTFIIGGPAEDTGTGFRRHLYWYGTDRDGAVVQFIYAITDTTVRDDEDVTEDEEDRRFNPVLDITTVTEPEGFVGWTTQTDSLFIFTVDRESEQSKQITFHIVSVDDRGAIDPTPARLRFFNNAAGTPKIKFRMYANVDPVTGDGGDLRWVGVPGRADADSPEQTDNPFAGFQKPFRIEWEASTPNQTMEFEDSIIGYRYKARQGPGFPFTPGVDSLGNKIFDDTTTFFFANNTPGDELGPECDDSRGIGCDPVQLRWPSGGFVLSVETIDRALVQNRVVDGQLTFQVNYPPETLIEPEATFVVRDEGGSILTQGTFVDGDRIPYGSEVTFVSSGFDRFLETIPAGVDPNILCCDTPFEFDPDNPDLVPEVRFTERIIAFRTPDFDEAPQQLSSTSGAPNELGSVTFAVAPYEYTYISTAVDELDRFDNEPAAFNFSVGFTPTLRPDLGLPDADRGIDRLVVAIPTGAVEGDSLLLGSPSSSTVWLIKDASDDRCGARLSFDSEEVAAITPTPPSFAGFLFKYAPRLVAQNDPRDPLGTVNAWSYSLNSVNDPENEIEDGAESDDLKFFISGSAPNVLDFREDPVVGNEERELSFFVPFDFSSPAGTRSYDADSEDEDKRQLGCLLAQRLGEMKLRYRGRVTSPTLDPFPFFQNRDESGENKTVPENTRAYGPKSESTETTFYLFVAIDSNGDGVIDPELGERYWPDDLTFEGLK